MNKNELKKVLKPLIKECIKEVLFEEGGTLSHIISEVANGLSTTTTKRVVKQSPEVKWMKNSQAVNETASRGVLKQKKQKLLDAIGREAYGGVNLFEGTTPAPAPTDGQTQGPLSGVSPNDPGVDISGLFGAKAFAVSKKMMENK